MTREPMTDRDLVREAREWARVPGYPPQGTSAFFSRLAYALEAAVARADQLEREREERGPFFVRDMALLAGLPADASMDAIYKALRAALAVDAQETKT